MDAKELSQTLAKQALAVAQHLLPQGRKESGQWVCGSVDGEKGSSLSVCIAGPKAGTWKDFATAPKSAGLSGDLLDLWKAVKRCSLPDACQEAQQWAGITSHDKTFHLIRPKANYLKPQLSPSTRPLACSDAARRYLTEERKIEADTLQAFQVMTDGEKMLFPSYNEQGELIRWKSIDTKLDAKNKKIMHTSKDSAPVLFGWQAFPKDSRSVVLCEGEIDCLTLHQLGWSALSVPNGCGNLQWIDEEWERLQCFDDVIISMDADEAGQKAAQEIAQRLGSHRCRVVDWQPLGIKDPNEGLQKGIDLGAMHDAIHKAKPLDPIALKSAESFREELLNRLSHADELTGHSVPWFSLSQRYRVRPSELTILTGMNGSGKSQLLGQLMLHLMNQGEKVCIASMELRPVVTVDRILRQALTVKEPTYEFKSAGIDWLINKLWLFTVTGTAKTEQLFEVFTYAHRRYGVTQFVVDSLMKCGVGEDDYNGQKTFVDRLCDFKMETGCHVWLVAHPRKGENEHTAPSKLDVKGASTITDLADNVLSLWRNPNKRESVNAYGGDKINNEPDGLLTVCKQRDGGWEGRCQLWFDDISCQYTDTMNGKPWRYVNYSNGSPP